MSVSSPEFWIALGYIIWINIVLSGDNAVVIALAAKALPPHQQRKAIAIGAGAAVVLRIVLTFVAAALLNFPYIKIVGGALLLYIGVQLLSEGDDDADADSAGHATMGMAIRTILIADVIMSLDNVIGVALAAKGDMLLLGLGLAISIPIVVFGSTLLIKLMERFPWIVILGAALIGWVAGEAITKDLVLKPVLGEGTPITYAIEVSCAVLVVALGLYLAHRNRSKTAQQQ